MSYQKVFERFRPGSEVPLGKVIKEYNNSFEPYEDYTKRKFPIFKDTKDVYELDYSYICLRYLLKHGESSAPPIIRLTNTLNTRMENVFGFLDYLDIVDRTGFEGITTGTGYYLYPLYSISKDIIAACPQDIIDRNDITELLDFMLKKYTVRIPEEEKKEPLNERIKRALS